MEPCASKEQCLDRGWENMVEPSLNMLEHHHEHHYGTSCYEWWSEGLSSNVIIVSYHLSNLQCSTDPVRSVRSTKMLQNNGVVNSTGLLRPLSVLNHEVANMLQGYLPLFFELRWAWTMSGLDLQCCSATPAGSGYKLRLCEPKRFGYHCTREGSTT